jgi:hypothetical protein
MASGPKPFASDLSFVALSIQYSAVCPARSEVQTSLALLSSMSGVAVVSSGAIVA